MLFAQHLPKRFRQTDIQKFCGIGEKRRDFAISETCNAAANARDKKFLSRMLFCILDETIDVRFYGFHPTLHGRDGVALSGRADAYTPFCAKFRIGNIGRAAAMMTSQIAAEDEDFI